MTKTDHTPGPWRVEEGTTVIWSDNAYDSGTNCIGCIVARAAQPPSWKASRPTADEQEANARLIAAAPDLLEALREFADYHSADLTSDFGNEAARMRQALAAIAKAEGRSVLIHEEA